MRKVLGALVLVLMAVGVFAQSPKYITGNWSALKGQTSVEFEFTYNNLMVGKKTEAEYLSEKEEKFVESWKEDRPNRHEPKFEELFNKYVEGKGLKGGRTLNESKYKVLIHIPWLAPGWYAGISSAPSEVTFEFTLIDKENNNAEVAKMTIERVPGNSVAGMDMGERLKESYAKSGKIFGNYLFKKALK